MIPRPTGVDFDDRKMERIEKIAPYMSAALRRTRREEVGAGGGVLLKMKWAADEVTVGRKPEALKGETLAGLRSFGLKINPREVN